MYYWLFNCNIVWKKFVLALFVIYQLPVHLYLKDIQYMDSFFFNFQQFLITNFVHEVFNSKCLLVQSALGVKL